MSFRGLLRPGQGFQPFRVLRRKGGLSPSGRPCAKEYRPQGTFLGILTESTPKEIEQFKQAGTPITHTIVQRGTDRRAGATDVLELDDGCSCDIGGKPRRFLVHGEPKNPGDLGHFLIYQVEERVDLP